MFKALTQRDFTILWVGQTISLLGDGIFTVALAWQALELPNGTVALGVVMIVRSVARVATLLVGGALADRYQKRFLILFGEVLQMVAVAALAYLVATDQLELWELTTVAGVAGVGSGIFLASSSAIVPELVDENYYQSANSLRSSAFLMASDLLGPALGGVLIAAFGTATAFAIDAATFVASIFALLMIRSRRIETELEKTSFFREVREGISYVLKKPWLWVSLLAVGTVGNFVAYGPLPVTIPLLIQEDLGGGASDLGFVLAGFGVGGLFGALVGGALKFRRRTPVPAYIGWMTCAMALGLLAFSPNVAVAGLLFGIAGFAGQIAEVAWVTLQQTLVPARLLGRVTSTDWLLSLSLQPAGVALASPVASLIGVTGTIFAGATIAVAACAVGLTVPSVRDPSLTEDLHPSAVTGP